MIRLFPADQLGIRLDGKWGKTCGKFSRCWDTLTKFVKPVTVTSFCAEEAYGVWSINYNVRLNELKWLPDTNCTRLLCYQFPPPQLDPAQSCDNCVWTNGEAMVAPVDESVAGVCVLNMTGPGGAIFTEPLYFNLTDQPQGVTLLQIPAGAPDESSSQILVVELRPGETPPEFLNASDPPFPGIASDSRSFDLAVILRDAAGIKIRSENAGLRAELRSADLPSRALPPPVFDSVSGTARVRAAVTVAGRYS